MGGSDEGMEMLIAGVIKGLANRIDLQLTNKTLIYECPSWVTISRNEKRLAALSIIALVKELQYD